MIKTRFAPSPTGFLHIGGARTALFAWAFAKKNGGQFYLRIEDTDLERSTLESVDSIIDAMQWLGLTHDNREIYYQSKHFPRYQEIIAQLLNQGDAYHCYCSKEELEEMREEQKTQGLKPKYDRRCLHNKTVKAGVKPVVRFKNPDSGNVVWDDMVKGTISINNEELDDLIIARSDGSPTYNLCVVVDDFDMAISHVIRGDDHVNNTPRQINILKALNATIPQYAHLPMILRADGNKMSKRTDAVSVMAYHDMGILPQALLNYLSRLCFGHGNDEIFTVEQFVNWFDLTHISPSAARFDLQKLMWVNAEHIKLAPDQQLAKQILTVWEQQQDTLNAYHQKSFIDLPNVIALYKSRVNNLNTLALECSYLYKPASISADDQTKHLSTAALDILQNFAKAIANISIWNLDNIKLTIKDFCNDNSIKMPELGMPLRLKLCGTTQTPSFDAIINLLGRDEVLARLR